MSKKKRVNKEINPKSKEFMKEIADIVKNSETDEAALEFLQETLDDDFPDLELGTMDLHEAIKNLGGSDAEPIKKKEDVGLVGDLNRSLGEFIDKQESNHNNRKRKRKKRKGKRRKRRKKK